MALGIWIKSLMGQVSVGTAAKEQTQHWGAGRPFRNRKMLAQLSCTMELYPWDRAGAISLILKGKTAFFINKKAEFNITGFQSVVPLLSVAQLMFSSLFLPCFKIFLSLSSLHLKNEWLNGPFFWNNVLQTPIYAPLTHNVCIHKTASAQGTLKCCKSQARTRLTTVQNLRSL